MTPKEYLKIEKAQQTIIRTAEGCIFMARRLADKCPLPTRRRPATADDLEPGAIIWHERPDKLGGNYWAIVDHPVDGSYGFISYMTTDGDRHSVDNCTYVEI